MWCITGTLPDPDFALCPAGLEGESTVAGGLLHLPDGQAVPVQRGTAALAATAILACRELGIAPPRLLLAGDPGSGTGSRTIYAWLEQNLAGLSPAGLTFHYLFPDQDWHNRVLMATQALAVPPVMVADAGFMYVAKMSGYADAYDLFTPDLGELAFLADEKAPHPFYTRGFLLAREDDVPPLLQRALEHGNCPKNLIIKGSKDYIVVDGRVIATVDAPSVPAMECIGGTGDLVTGLATAFLCGGAAMDEACTAAARMARLLAQLCAPNPGTQIGELIEMLPEAMRSTRSVWPTTLSASSV
ncbi:NAD(P)H-hydrate dehydratase [uncultured Desulfovibrio sp.]|uniref:NAD(P)H-hydrate dehydratase n=1 Tax=uncultured Desulfovibrio sp. TaxID=167968 RepID=UPI00261BF270|nr:NAD(P)H-hydrate dehydratase [uncultured Desulfovibrio sp.]